MILDKNASGKLIRCQLRTLLLAWPLLIVGAASGSGTTSDGVSVTGIGAIDFWSFSDQGLSVGAFDPVLFVDPDSQYQYMYVGDGNEDGNGKGQDLYRSTDLRGWTKIADNVKDQNGTTISTEGGTNFNWGRKVNGTYYLYQSRQDTAMHLYTGTDLANLTYRGQVLDESDAGGFYDDTTNTWHMYYESGNISGPSGDALGHATSTDGINWTKQPNLALNFGPSGDNTGWKTGDPDIIKVNDTYHMFIDNTVNHPNYRIAWATSTDLYTWELQEHAITHWPGGDAVVRYLPESDEFIMYQEYRGAGSGRKGIGYATAPAKGFVTSEAIDPATVGGLRMWLRDAETDFVQGPDATDAIWNDSSGNANHMQTLATAATADPTLISVTDPRTGRHFSAVQFADAATELMKSDLLGDDSDDADTEDRFTNLTVFTVYRVQQVTEGNVSNMRPVGVGSERDGTSADNFNLASDSSIRKDNGSIDESDQALPINEFFIRISRMTQDGGNDDDIDEWLHIVGGQLDLLQTRGASFTTSDDDFFLGDLRVDGSGLSGDDFAIAEVLVFDQSLTDAQVIGIDAYLSDKYIAIPEPNTLMLLAPCLLLSCFARN